MKKSKINSKLLLIAIVFFISIGLTSTASPKPIEVKTEKNNIEENASKTCSLDEKLWDKAFAMNASEAVELLLENASNGNPTAQFILGGFYEEGRGVAPDQEKSFCWNKKSADQGLLHALVNQGIKYYYGYGVEQDYRKAFETMLICAKAGLPGSQYSIGKLYAEGRGVTQDRAKAFNWIYKAAVQNDEKAQLFLLSQNHRKDFPKEFANLNFDIQSTAQDFEWILFANECIEKFKKQTKVIALFSMKEKASKTNSIPLEVSIAKSLNEKKSETVKIFQQKANDGNALAQFLLGTCYQTGNGMSFDLKKSLSWNTKAAEQGLATAQFLQGVKYYFGHGTEQNLKTAFFWFRKAALQENVFAWLFLENLGLQKVFAYEFSEIGSDKIEALKWFYIANETFRNNSVKLIKETNFINLLPPEDIAQGIDRAKYFLKRVDCANSNNPPEHALACENLGAFKFPIASGTKELNLEICVFLEGICEPSLIERKTVIQSAFQKLISAKEAIYADDFTKFFIDDYAVGFLQIDLRIFVSKKMLKDSNCNIHGVYFPKFSITPTKNCL